MIAHLTGEILVKKTSYAIIDVGGMGYQVNMPTPAIAELPSAGERVSLWTYLLVREDDISLFGFMTEEDKELFEKLMTVSGVGPKVSLAALSTMSASELIRAIEDQDVTKISSVSGIGKKGAQRIALELKGKLAPVADGLGSHEPTHPLGDEVIAALLAMGFSPDEAATAVEGYDGPPRDSKAALTYALKRLGASR